MCDRRIVKFDSNEQPEASHRSYFRRAKIVDSAYDFAAKPESAHGEILAHDNFETRETGGA